MPPSDRSERRGLGSEAPPPLLSPIGPEWRAAPRYRVASIPIREPTALSPPRERGEKNGKNMLQRLRLFRENVSKTEGRESSEHDRHASARLARRAACSVRVMRLPGPCTIGGIR